MMEQVTVVIVTYNSADVILEAIKAVSQYKRIIVVDNASTDDTVAVIASAFPHVKCLVNEENIGFGRANNRALEQITTPYAMLLNPDTVAEPHAIERLVQAAGEFPDAAICAPMLVDAQGHVDHSYKQNLFVREKHRCEFIIPEGPLCAEFVSGAAMLLRMEYFNQLGFFEPRIFLFYEDDDLCLRANQAGYSVVYVPSAKVLHAKGASSRQHLSEIFHKNRHRIQSRLFLQNQAGPANELWKLALTLAIHSWLKSIGYVLCMRPRKVAKYLGQLAGAVTSPSL